MEFFECKYEVMYEFEVKKFFVGNIGLESF